MAIIKTLHDDDGVFIYPNTVTRAIYSQDGTPLDKILSKVLGESSEYNGPDMLSLLTNLSNPNLLINGGFTINSRNNTEYSGLSDSKWSVDAWKLSASSVVLKPNNPGTGVRLTDINNPNIHDILMYTIIPDVHQYAGYDITVSMKFKSRTDFNDIGLSVGNEASTIYSGICKDLEGILTVTRRITNEDKEVRVNIYRECRFDMDVDIEWVKAEIGSVATPYIPKPVNDELNNCYRLYEVIDQPVEAFINKEGSQISFILPRRSIFVANTTTHVVSDNIRDGIMSVPNETLIMGVKELLQGVDEPFSCHTEWTPTRVIYTIDITRTTLSRDLALKRMLVYGIKFIVESDF